MNQISLKIIHEDNYQIYSYNLIIKLVLAPFIQQIFIEEQTMLSQVDKLTPLAISKVLQSQAENESIIVQVFDIILTKNGKIICTVSDGDYCTKAYLNDDSIVKPGKDQYSIICIKSHGVFKNNVGITELQFVTSYPEKLGNPADWASSKENAIQLKPGRQFKLEKIIKKQLKTQSKKGVMQNANAETATKLSTGKQSDYESIDDLHFGLTRWTLLCRITSKKLKQSLKKGTKILQIELVDRSKKRIIGTFFNQSAIDFNQYLNEGSIYQISKGRLIQGNYNNSKNDKISPYALVFDSKSQFNQVSDVNIIVKSEDSAITLGNVYEKRILNQQFDVVAYVVDVKQETSYQKDDKTFKIKQVVLADPQAKITMVARLWRWSQQFGKDLIGKVLIFSRFVLNQYKGSINLSSGLRSSVISNHGHPMKRYQNNTINLSDFMATTQVRQKVDEDTSDYCFNTMELNQRVRRMSEGETIKSILYVWINRFLHMKKWNYEGCPKCRKAAEKFSKCNNPNCGYAIQQTTINFTMRAEVSDFFGSIWITIYDELGKKVFNDLGSNPAAQLNKLEKDELGEKLQNYLYQPLRLKIITKKNQEGIISHNAGRAFQLNDDRVARQNLKKIYLLMGHSN